MVSIVPSDDINLESCPCSVLIPCGMGDARNLLMALAGDACVVIGGRAGDLVDFEVIPVLTSAEAASTMASR